MDVEKFRDELLKVRKLEVEVLAQIRDGIIEMKRHFEFLKP